MPVPEVDQRARAARVATAGAFASQGLLFSTLVSHLPQFTDAYDMSQGAVSLVVLVVVVVAGAGSVLSEVVAARTSSRVTLHAGLLGVAVAATAIALAPGRVTFLVAFVLYGVALGVVDAASNMQGVAVQHAYGRSVIASMHASWSGAAIAGAIYVAAGERFDVPLPLSVLGPALLVGLGSFVLRPRLLTRDSPPVPAGGAVARGPLVPGSRILLWLGVTMACFWAVDSAVSNWSSLFLTDVLDEPGEVAPLGYAAYQATALLSRLGGDLVVRRRGAPFTVRYAALTGIAGAVLVVAAPSAVVALAGFALIGLGLPLLAPLTFAAAADAVRATPAGDAAAVDRAIARLNIWNYVGALAGAVLVGAVGTLADLRVAYLLAILLAAAIFLLAPVFAVSSSSRTRPTPAPGRTPAAPPPPS